jgi:hypothetical protein
MKLDALHILLICLIVMILLLLGIAPALLTEKSGARCNQIIVVLALIAVGHGLAIYYLS